MGNLFPVLWACTGSRLIISGGLSRRSHGVFLILRSSKRSDIKLDLARNRSWVTSLAGAGIKIGGSSVEYNKSAISPRLFGIMNKAKAKAPANEETDPQ